MNIFGTDNNESNRLRLGQEGNSDSQNDASASGSANCSPSDAAPGNSSAARNSNWLLGLRSWFSNKNRNETKHIQEAAASPSVFPAPIAAAAAAPADPRAQRFEILDAVSSVEKYRNRALMMVYPPPGPMAHDALAKYLDV